MSRWIKTIDKLPPEGKYVLARHSRGTWLDSEDQQNVNCVVVKLKKGITQKEREMMKNGKLPDEKEGPYWCLSDGHHFVLRSNLFKSEDEFGNNLVPYNFSQFGTDTFFGQDIICWQLIEDYGGQDD